jgi:hypothetical protein
VKPKKPKRASRALKRYHADLREIKKSTGQSYAESRGLWRKAVDSKGGERGKLNRKKLIEQAKEELKKKLVGPDTDLGFTVWTNLLEWFKKSIQDNREVRFELDFADIGSNLPFRQQGAHLLKDMSDSTELSQEIRSKGDKYFWKNPELGFPSFYWRIGGDPAINPHAVEMAIVGSATFYKFTWKDEDGQSG